MQSRQKRLSARTQVGARPRCACETSDAVSLMRSEIARIPLRRLSLTWCRRSRGATPLRVTVPSVERSGSKGFLRRDQPLPTLRSRSLRIVGSPPIGGFCGICHWLSSHRTTLPVRAVQVTATPWLPRQSSLSTPSRS